MQTCGSETWNSPGCNILNLQIWSVSKLFPCHCLLQQLLQLEFSLSKGTMFHFFNWPYSLELLQDWVGMLTSVHFCSFPSSCQKPSDCPLWLPSQCLPLVADSHMDTVAGSPQPLWAVIFSNLIDRSFSKLICLQGASDSWAFCRWKLGALFWKISTSS
jgi:hypothetical protein